ncbi:MAG TPA: A/G-specific adenine glycosylase [Chitinophagales bacterium]|nr:A/G-specific adenine glycosylase [Chitinophagales bacterium]
MESFSKKLLEWYNPKLRNLPWKNTKDAYKIWLSEIILQQTRVEQGTPYYLAFIKKYPKINLLANAPLDEVLKLWEGLGYYSRARNLHASAQQVLHEHKGNFPKSYEELKKIKGIGNYTAAAIASFAYGLPHAVVDGNVYRVLSRVYGIFTPIDTNQGKKQFETIAQKLLDKKNPSVYNQAIMDFGSLVCKPKNPLCKACPFQDECQALAMQKIGEFPVKSKKTSMQKREFYFFVYKNKGYTYIVQRDQQDIWKGLYEFPFVEIKSEKDKSRFKKLKPVYTDKQQLSHQIIHADFFEIEEKTKLMQFFPDILQFKKIKITTLENYAFPKIIRNYLQQAKLFLS